MTSLKPIEIIGGGLAGLALGNALCRAGVPVAVFEAAGYPRHRVCGEFITGLAPATIERLHLGPHLAGASEHRDIAWFHRHRFLRTQRLPTPALGISRHTLDARLAEAFVAAGGDLHTHTRVNDETAPPGRVFARGRRRHRHSSWLGLKIHARGLDVSSDLELHLGDHAYVGLTRVEGDRVNLCGIFRQRELAARGVALLPAYLRAVGLDGLAGRLEGSEQDTTSFCAVAAVGFDRQTRSSDRLELGDTAAMIPPFSGNGMAMAFQGAELALGPLLDYARGDRAWPATVRSVNAALHRKFRRRLASAAVLHPFLLHPVRQRWLAAVTCIHLLPLRPLYAALH